MTCHWQYISHYRLHSKMTSWRKTLLYNNNDNTGNHRLCVKQPDSYRVTYIYWVEVIFSMLSVDIHFRRLASSPISMCMKKLWPKLNAFVKKWLWHKAFRKCPQSDYSRDISAAASENVCCWILLELGISCQDWHPAGNSRYLWGSATVCGVI